MDIKVLMITHDRPRYTKLSLERLLRTMPAGSGVIVWDNASSKETVDVIRSFEGRPHLEKVIYSARNERLWAPTDWFFRTYGKAEFLSKVDDDCLVPPGWCEVLGNAHREIINAGVLGCWRFLPEDFNMENASRKIFGYGRHLIMRNCWIEGSGFIMKRAVLEKIGRMRPSETFSDYCVRASVKGFVNGWYYPFLYQEHMDDPRAAHTGMETDDDFMRLAPLSARNFGIRTREAWINRLKDSAQKLQQYSIDPCDYVGIRARLKRKIHSMMGTEYFPKMQK